MNPSELIVGGIAHGCVYGLVALAFVLVFKATDTVSFVHGDLMMFGAFVAFGLGAALRWPAALSVLPAMAIVAALGALMHRLALRRLPGQLPFAGLMVTIGLGLMLRATVVSIPGWGAQTHAMPVPLGGAVWRIGPVAVPAAEGLVIAATALLCALLWAFFRHTALGLAMRAVADNHAGAAWVGIPVARLHGWTWAASAACAALAGVLLAPITFVHHQMGGIALKAFPAAVLGGIGSLPGAVVGGILIGLTESLAGLHLGEAANDALPYLIVIAVLLVRPQGLFGTRAPHTA